MKTIMQALGISFIIHIIYFSLTLIVSYLQTRNYNPSIANGWTEVEMPQNEVVFGTVGSPFFMLLSFIGVALISVFFIFFFGKVIHLKRGESGLNTSVLNVYNSKALCKVTARWTSGSGKLSSKFQWKMGGKKKRRTVILLPFK